MDEVETQNFMVLKFAFVPAAMANFDLTTADVDKVLRSPLHHLLFLLPYPLILQFATANSGHWAILRAYQYRY
jgi:hypothetical protein